MIKYFQLLVLIFITSCASIPQTLVTFNKEVIKTPSLNTEISQELGNTLVEYSVLSYVDSISINEEYRTEPNFAGLYSNRAIIKSGFSELEILKAAAKLSGKLKLLSFIS